MSWVMEKSKLVYHEQIKFREKLAKGGAEENILGSNTHVDEGSTFPVCSELRTNQNKGPFVLGKKKRERETSREDEWSTFIRCNGKDDVGPGCKMKRRHVRTTADFQWWLATCQHS